MTRRRGLFITVEGVEGAGKSSLIPHIRNALIERMGSCIVTREPGGSPLAEDIRRVLLTSQHEETWSHETELLLMYAARAQHLKTTILPNLEKGVHVISDRFSDASYAYQVVARGASLELFHALEQHITHPHEPDLTLLLDLDPELGMTRVRSRSTGLDRIETEKIEFFNHVRAGYLQRATQYSDRISVIRADRPQEKVIQDVQVVLKTMLDQYEKED